MKNNSVTRPESAIIPNGFYPMDQIETDLVNGGGFWDMLIPVSYITYYIYEFGKAAAEYQSSLPANLKK